MSKQPSQPAQWVIEFYQDARSRRPVENWLDDQDAKTVARVHHTFNLLREHGTQLGMPHSRHVRGKIWELRIAVGRRDYRMLYFAWVGKRFVLLHAFAKQTPRTPAADLDIAERRMAEYQALNIEGDEP
jgi:phage-related protein